MVDISELIRTIRKTPDCRVHPPDGMPSIRPGYVLPDDLREFYELCGGVDLYSDASFSVSIAAPRKMVLANPLIIENWSESDLREESGQDISWSWYIIAEAPNSQYLTIDLDPERVGQCYDSFWEIHPADSPIIATSFTDLLMRLHANRGQHWYWLEPEFQSLGSPYD